MIAQVSNPRVRDDRGTQGASCATCCWIGAPSSNPCDTRDGPADPCMDHPLTCPSALATGYKPSQACVECIYRAARCGRSATFSVQIMMAMSDTQVRGTHGAPGSGRPSRNCDGLKCGATAVFGCSAVPVHVEWPANHGKIQAQLEGPLPRRPVVGLGVRLSSQLVPHRSASGAYSGSY